MGIKNGKLLTSHRSTIYPCYLPVLGEFNRSWPYKTCRGKDRDLRIKNLKLGIRTRDFDFLLLIFSF